jgi:hypothetical protein
VTCTEAADEGLFYLEKKMKDMCENCRFYAKGTEVNYYSPISDNDLEADMKSHLAGRCKRYPPKSYSRFSAVSVKYNGEVDSAHCCDYQEEINYIAHPVVYSDMWCGEFQQRKQEAQP